MYNSLLVLIVMYYLFAINITPINISKRKKSYNYNSIIYSYTEYRLDTLLID